MTDDNRRKKAQAVFFSLVMVLSMVGGSVALAGSAAAAANDLTVESGTPSPADGEITVSTSIEEGDTQATFRVIDSEDATELTKTVDDGGAEDSNSEEADGVIETTLDLNTAAEGQATVYVSSGDSVSSSTADDSVTFTVDDTAPSASSSSPTNGEEVSSTTEDIEIDLSDNENGVGIDTSSINLVLSQDGTEFVDLNGISTDGISYDEANGVLTVSPGDGKIPELPAGQVDVALTAQDGAGNSLDAGPLEYSFTVNTQEPTFDLTTPANGLTNSDTQRIDVDVNDGASYATINSVEVTITQDGSAVSRPVATS